MHWALLISVGKFFFTWNRNYPKFFEKLRKSVHPLAYDAFVFLVPNIIWNYCGCMFQLLEFQKNWQFYSNTGFYYNAVVYLLFAFTLSGYGQRPPRAKTPEQEKPKSQ